jgi:signal transduction histidine kinase/AmiR/NasT family two-component response regulator
MVDQFQFSEDQLQNLFPCYILTDQELVLRSVGRSLRKLIPDVAAGVPLTHCFKIERPRSGFDPAVAARRSSALQFKSMDGRVNLVGTVLEVEHGYLFCMAHSAMMAQKWGELDLSASDFSSADQSMAIGTSMGLQSVLMSEMKDLATNLAKARDEALAANRAKSTFLSVMSHEIRTPLNGVLGMVHVLLKDAPTEQQRSRLEIVRESGDALLAILNDLLDISRIEAGKMSLESIEFDIREVLSGAYAAFTAIANKSGLSFILDIDPAAGIYLGDPTRVRQVAYNFLSNALKFTKEGRVVLSARLVDGGLEISVLDTGIGIADDRLDGVFDPFVQADASVNRHFGGTGLGLGISRDLAKLMGGSIRVESELGKGSTFTAFLQIPRLRDATETLRVVNDDEPVASQEIVQSLRVLAAEDNLVNQLVLRTLMEQFGITLTVVENGKLAVEAWESQTWDIILMDMQMPVMGGVEASRLIREQERATGRAKTPIIAVTANAMTHHMSEYESAGINGVVSKPIKADALANVLIKVLDELASSQAQMAEV